MKFKLLVLTAVGALLFVGAGCGQVKPAVAPPASPAAQVQPTAASVDPVDSEVNATIKDVDAEADAVADEAADVQELNTDSPAVNSLQTADYDVKE